MYLNCISILLFAIQDASYSYCVQNLCKHNHSQQQPSTTVAPSTFQWSYREIEHYNIKSRSQKQFNLKSFKTDGATSRIKDDDSLLEANRSTEGADKEKHYNKTIIDVKTDYFADNKNAENDINTSSGEVFKGVEGKETQSIEQNDVFKG